ncbi:MAG: alpha/beta hydrolase [Moraxellaceae bacterium]|jgi:pimeloyl-ACP methyl ester carboxylesterase|nr:alpha/beta hydrolase [Moraxellaceae bacterium]
MAFVTARDGEKLHVRVLGRGRPVLLLHGLGSSSVQWLPFVLPLLGVARFYIPDLRGAGRSGTVSLNQPDMFQNHVEDVEDIVRHFGLRDFLLAGHSMGATTALHWQRLGGFANVRRYLHIDQSPCVSNRDDWRYGLLGEVQEDCFNDLRQLAELLTQHAHHDHLHALPPSARRRALGLLALSQEKMGNRAPARALRVAARLPALTRLFPLGRTRDLQRILTTYLATQDYRESLRQCSTPVTVMVGMRSTLYDPAGQMAIADYAPQCRVVRFERAGHLLPLDSPVQFMREFGRFIRE